MNLVQPPRHKGIRPPSGHDREASLGNEFGGFAGQLVVRILFGESSRAEDRHAGADEMKPSESSKKLVPDPEESSELESPRLRPLEKSKFWNLVLLPGPEWVGRGRSRGRFWRLHPFILEMGGRS
jgi:hypothetical protein